jgi:chemotaxis protein MotB
MTTYGDIMTLLLTFFVLLISYSTIQEEDFKRSVASFQAALGMLPYERSMLQFEQIPTIKFMPTIPPKEIIRRLRYAIYSGGLKGQMKVSRDREGIRITIKSPLLFDSGKAELRSDASPVLEELVTILADSPNVVVVEGHTDNVPISTEQFPSNWELSTARAISVAKFLFENGGFDPARFTVAGYGEYHPVQTNDTLEGRQENRRVEILLKNIEPDFSDVEEGEA